MAQSAARKSQFLKVVSSSLTGRKSRRIILIALYPTIKICKKRNVTNKKYNQLKLLEPK